VSRQLEKDAREHAVHADAGHVHHAAGSDLPWRERLTSTEAWSDVAHNFRGDWTMLYKEITIGFLLAGFIALLGDDFFNALFLTDAPEVVQVIWGAIIGPVIAVLSFVCSVGNVPLAAVLWSGGISFSGVMAFIFADLIVLPIIFAYRKYYGTSFALRITALMYVTMVTAALLIDLLFSALGLIPDTRPSTSDVFGSIEVDYKLVLNIVATVIFAALMLLTVRRGATDPVCGMSVDKSKARTLEYEGRSYYFCSDHCKATFESDPERYAHGGREHDDAHATHAHTH
jgi:YHS domain-containing protein